MFFNKKNKARTIDTLIDKGITVRGNVTYSGGMRIDGSIIGNLTELPGTAGTLIMGNKSLIKGNVSAHHAIIGGNVDGNITCAEYLELHANAKVFGDIKYKVIEIHAGAKVYGQLKEIAKDLNQLPKKK
ncbi:MAG: polymer-forming cytoskeletal protein [Candidatus Methylopumilus sp.]|nr:polymer-forming cytoskeletal protein [Candidatus Methylopumilus sp.]